MEKILSSDFLQLSFALLLPPNSPPPHPPHPPSSSLPSPPPSLHPPPHLHLPQEDEESGCLSPTSSSSFTNSICDGRLFPGYPLYCEGFHKPLLRGVLHFLVAFFVLPWACYLLLLETGGPKSPYASLVAVLYILSNIFCYGCSGFYHIFEWEIQTEIFLQKLDHCGIAILSTGTMLPTSLLLLPYEYGIFLISTSTLLCLYTCYKIFSLQPSLLLQAIVAIWWLIPYFPLFLQYMTLLEIGCVLGTCFFQGLGIYVFVNKFPNPIPNIFGYHETFHFFVTLAGLAVFLGNYSIIHRQFHSG